MREPALERFGAVRLRLFGLREPGASSVEPLDQVLRVGIPLLVLLQLFPDIGKPLRRHRVDYLAQRRLGQARTQARVGYLEVTRAVQKHVVGNLDEGRLNAVLPAL